MLVRLWLLIGGLCCTLAYNYKNGELLSCSSHNPQRNIHIDAMLGQWYIIEIIHHIPHRFRQIVLDKRVLMKSCPTVYLSSLKADHTVLSLSWTEPNLYKIYTMKALSHQHEGTWVSSEGSNPKETGNIEIMKAVRDHIVLTFCKVDQNSSELFSAIMSRDGMMGYEARRYVEDMLRRRHLSEYIVKETCSGAFTILSTSLFIFWTILALLLK